MIKLLRKKIISISSINDNDKTLCTSSIKIFNYHGNQCKRMCLDRNFCLLTKSNKIIQKIEWFLLIKKNCLLVIRHNCLCFCITKLWIRPNCYDYLWSLTKLVDYLVDYLEVSDNLQDKTKCLLSLEKFMQIKTNPKVQSNPKGFSFL